MNKIIILALLLVLSSCSCNNSDPKVRIDKYYVDDYEIEIEDTDVITVPYREYGGIKTIDVKINGMGVEMIFDTGCSSTLISAAEAFYLVQKGYLVEEDIIGTSRSIIADGSIVENTVIILRELRIDDQLVFTNVRAEVSNNIEAPLLLGNEILNRATSYTIDNVNKVIKFKKY